MTNTKSQRSRRRAFTLIEIMIVVVIIAMLAALVGPNIIGSFNKAKVNSTKAQLVNLKNAIQQYYMDLSSYPNSLDDLVKNPGNDSWHGPYLEAKSIPLDGWGNEFNYTVPGEDDMPFDLDSFGADKTAGGDGYNADLSCWN